ncbi:MAG: gamma carbonic anhydrase family protein [Planctomycetota bacterium]|jgi:carbonic anhydrase/acetyltransferase-like protein (isoleucine patch superfamily)
MNPHDVSVVLGEGVYIAPTSYVGGDVVLGDHCTVMPHASIRGDLAPIRLGCRVNVQDGAVLHTDLNVPLELGDDVTIGHGARVHCRSIGAGSLIGIGAILLDDVVVGEGCVIAAGAVVTAGTKIPDAMLVVGAPARIKREVNDRERAYIRLAVDSYVKLGAQHKAGGFPNVADEHRID